jgi:hypothetical protein
MSIAADGNQIYRDCPTEHRHRSPLAAISLVDSGCLNPIVAHKEMAAPLRPGLHQFNPRARISRIFLMPIRLLVGISFIDRLESNHDHDADDPRA